MAERDEVELLRLRSHDHAERLVSIESRVGWLELFRDKYQPIVDELRESDRIAEAVATTLSNRKQLGLTRVEKLIASVLGTITAVSAIVAAIESIRHTTGHG